MARRRTVPTRISCRYYDEAGHRVFPYDGYEALTEAPPAEGKGQRLLYSANNSIKPANGVVRKFAWCFACEDWVLGKRETQHQIMLRYLQRTHVQLRVEGGQRQQILALTQILEERRRK